jgi:hypothetical protein
MTLTASQVHAARTLLKWPQHRMADELRTRLSEYRSFEAGRVELSMLQISVLRRVLERAGVIFDVENGERPGVRLRER